MVLSRHSRFAQLAADLAKVIRRRKLILTVSGRFMNVREAYGEWAETYDGMPNKTRDLEALALRKVLGSGKFCDVLEIGCGTGKNTFFLKTKAENLVAADFSPEMLAKARKKTSDPNIVFHELDLRRKWDFPECSFDLLACSLVLEHIKNLEIVFSEACRVLRSGGVFYFGELHPFKQYLGSKARFETESGISLLECFTHHFSEYFETANNTNLNVSEVKEWFDDNDRTNTPRLLTMILLKK